MKTVVHTGLILSVSLFSQVLGEDLDLLRVTLGVCTHTNHFHIIYVLT